MKLIVGLGNPGEKYANTRHNLGFMAADTLLEKLEPLKKTFWEDEAKLKSQIKQIKLGDTTLLLAKPTTYMNDSGIAVSKILNYYKIDPTDLIVIYDDLDMPFGKIRVRFGGGAGGHHGVESIMEQIKSDKFLRIRLGIGEADGRRSERPNQSREAVSEFVLGKLSSSERGKVRTMIKETVKICEKILEHGIDTYMSRYNK